MKVIQWNCRSINSNRVFLEMLIEKHDPDILLLSETWLKNSQSFNLQGFNVFRRDRMNNSRGGGVMVATKTYLAATIVPLQLGVDEEEVIAVTVTWNRKQITFFSAYRPPLAIMDQRRWSQIFSKGCALSFVGGDFNCHHSLWGCEQNDGPGYNLLEVMDNLRFALLNDGTSSTRIMLGNRRSVVDITMASPGLAHFCSWAVDSNHYGSDHFPIVVTIRGAGLRHGAPPGETKRGTLGPPSIRPQEGNWPEYSRLVRQMVSDGQDDVAVVLRGAGEAVFGVTPRGGDPAVKRVPKHADWWDDKCRQAAQELQLAWRIFRADRSSEKYELVKENVTKLKECLTLAKFASWQSYCEGLRPDTPITEVWKTIKMYKATSLADACSFTGEPEWLGNFLRRFTPQSVNNIGVVVEDCEPASELDKPITMSELESVSRDLKDTAPGIDGIPYSLLRNLPQEGKVMVTNYFNEILRTGDVPDDWKKTVLVPVLKPKKDPSVAESYRPISKLVTTRKLFGRILVRRLERWLEQKKVIPKNQFAFRRGRGTQDAVAYAHLLIEKALGEKCTAVVCKLDIEGAYDAVNLDILTAKLIEKGASRRFALLIQQLFCRRLTWAKFGKFIAGPRETSQGLSQGDVISPLLFNFYVSDILRINYPGVEFIQYADDILIISCGAEMEEAASNLNMALNDMCSKLHDLGLQVSAQKTEMAIFTKKVAPDGGWHVPVSIWNRQVTLAPTLMFLGVVFDSKLRWKAHLKYIEDRVEKRINMIRSLCGTWWGAANWPLLCLYRALVRPILDYGGTVFGNAASTNCIKLEKLQYRCLRIVLGAMPSSPTDALLVEAAEMPLGLRRNMLAERAFVKLALVPDHPLSTLVGQLVRVDHPICKQTWTPLIIKAGDKLTEYVPPMRELPLVFLPPEGVDNVYNVVFSTVFDDTRRYPEMAVPKFFRRIVAERWPGAEYIFTDGSKSSDGVGAAVVNVTRAWAAEYKLHELFTSYSAELFALEKALTHVLTIVPGEVCIFTDSKSALEAIKNVDPRNIQNYIVLAIIDKLEACRQAGFQIKLIWVPAHVGIVGNEVADQKAKHAAVDGMLMDSRPPIPDILRFIKREKLEAWQSDWTNRQLPTTLWNIQKQIPIQPWFQKSKLTREVVATIVRLRLGHTSSPASLFRIGLRATDTCEFCSGVGDAAHIIFSCIEGVEARQYLLRSLDEAGLDPPYNFERVLGSLSPRVYSAVALFLRGLGIKL